jgi:hypothetical protein
MTLPRAGDEIFTDVLLREDVRIERIVSTGQSTPADNLTARGMTNGCYCSPVRRASASNAKVTAIFVQAIMFSSPLTALTG